MKIFLFLSKGRQADTKYLRSVTNHYGKKESYLIYDCCSYYCYYYYYYYYTTNPLRPSYYVVKVNIFPVHSNLQPGKERILDKDVLIMFLISFSS